MTRTPSLNIQRIMQRALGAIASVVLFGSVAEAQGAGAILDRVRVNPRRPIDFHAIALPDSVYVGQQATYQVAVLLSADARSRLRRNPEFLPPELRGLLAYELGTPTRIAPRSFDGAVFEAHIFQRALFPVAAGMQTVPAPQLSYTLPQSSSYFSREERFVVRAESASFVVRPLPLEGRPEDFNGAVGVFKSTVKIDTSAARVGDPLVMTLRVQGTGNVKLLPRPALEIEWASAVPGSERIQVDSSGPLVRGVKEFDWILTPGREGRVSLPSIRYSYFDPYAARYAVAESAPLELGIRAGSLAVADEGEGSAAILPLRADGGDAQPTRYWTGRGMPPTSALPWIFLLVFAPVPVLLLSRRRRAAPSVTSTSNPVMTTAERRAAAASEGEKIRERARDARRELLAVVAARFDRSPQDLVSRTDLARVMRRGGVTRATTRDVISALDQLDALAYAESNTDVTFSSPTSATAHSVAELAQRIDAEALPRGRRVGIKAMTTLLLIGAVVMSSTSVEKLVGQTPVSVTAAPQLSDTRAERIAARAAYERRAFAEATQRFAALAVRYPRDASLLANWGTAAWSAGDTVSAVIGWHRAARIEPLAVDLQERMRLLPAGARGGIADIPMVPVSALLVAGVALWLTGWAGHALRSWQLKRASSSTRSVHSDWLRLAANVAVVGGLVALGAAWWGARALDASALAVVSRPETLRIAPGVDADAMGGVSTGDVVRIEESRDAWRRVWHADGRKGWLPSARLRALDAEAAASAVLADTSAIVPVDLLDR